MKNEKLGICAIISFLSYTAMVIFSPLAYENYNFMTMAVSELSAQNAPSQMLANELNALFGPCAIVSIMAVCVSIYRKKSAIFKLGIYFFAAMEWICNVGYTMFPFINDDKSFHIENIFHIIVTILVVVFSILGLIFIAFGARKEKLKSLSIFAIICLLMMIVGSLGTALLIQEVFGLFERFSTFSVVVFNMVLGIYLLKGKFSKQYEI